MSLPASGIDIPEVPDEFKTLPVVDGTVEPEASVAAPEPTPAPATQTAPQATPQPAQTPAPEAPDKAPNEINFDTFNKIINGELDSGPAPEPVKPAPAAPQKPAERDLSFADDVDRPIFKQMSNEAFTRLREVYVKRKEAEKRLEEVAKKGSIPESYYENPDAVLLTPDYQEHLKKATLSQQILEHWQEQISNIRARGKWRPLNMDKEGNISIGDELEADDKTEGRVATYLTHAVNQLATVRASAEQLANTFKNRVMEAQTQVQQTEKHFFGAAEQNKAFMELTDKIKASVPSAYRNHPVTSFAAKSFAALLTLQQEYEKLQAQVKTKASIAKDTDKAQPTVEAIGAGTGAVAAGGNNTVSFKDYLDTIGD